MISIVCGARVAFDRLLARMFDVNLPGRDGWVLKGGYALEMRFHRARATKDLDLTVRVTSIGQTPPDHRGGGSGRLQRDAGPTIRLESGHPQTPVTVTASEADSAS